MGANLAFLLIGAFFFLVSLAMFVLALVADFGYQEENFRRLLWSATQRQGRDTSDPGVQQALENIIKMANETFQK